MIVNEGVATVSYQLDEGLIEFRTAIDDGDFNRYDLYFFGSVISICKKLKDEEHNFYICLLRMKPSEC